MGRKKLYGAIDVGSHEIQMKIAELGKDEALRVVENMRRTLAFGTDTYKSGRISQPLLNECQVILKGFLEQLKGYRIGACRTVATSAFREAQNCALAIDQIRRGCGLSIEVLSNSEERACHIMAAAGLMPAFSRLIEAGTLLVDIGAGSLQITAYDKGEMIFSQNMLLGSLRIRELLADLERRTADFAGLMDEYVSVDLDDYHLLEPKGTAYQNLIVLGGQANHLKKLAGHDPESLAVMNARQFEQVYQQLLSVRPLDLALEKSIPAEHASLMLPSAMIIRKFINFSRASHLYMPAITLCDGILLDYARDRGDFTPVHDQTLDIISVCRNLARRFKIDRKHADFVEKAALQLFDETHRLHRLPERSRLLLQVAAILHDTGKYINMSKHNVRSFNIINAAEIIGLHRTEKDMVAWIARLHTGPILPEERSFTDLDSHEQMTVNQLAALLRLADALDAGHKQKIGDISVNLDEQEMMLSIATRQDIVLELWTLENKGDLFAEVYGFPAHARIRRLQP